MSSSTSNWPTGYTATTSSVPALSQTPPLANGYNATAITSGTFRAKLRWVYRDGDLNLAPNPPAQIIIRETASALWSYTGNPNEASGSGASDNGNGGAYTTLPSSLGGRSAGAWSTQIKSSSGIVERSITITSRGSIQISSPPALNNSCLQANGSYTVQLDNRAVSIACNDLGITYNRAPSPTGVGFVPVPHYVSPEGWIYAHTLRPVAPMNYPTFTFTAAPVGNWSRTPPSQYHWYSRIKDFALSGVWGDYVSSPTIPSLWNTYTYPDDYSSPERIHIHLTDGADGIESENYYFLTFHNKYEDWVRTITTAHPTTFIHGNPNNDWTKFTSYTNATTTIQPSVAIQIAATTQMQESGTIENTVGTGVEYEILKLTFQQKESITVSQTYTLSLTTTVTLSIPALTKMTVYTAPSWEDRWGVCSVWGTSGYLREGTWYGKKVFNTPLNYTFDADPANPGNPGNP